MSIFRPLFFFFIGAFFISCTGGDSFMEDREVEENEMDRYEEGITFIDGSNNRFRPFLINDSTIHIAVPNGIDLCNMTVSTSSVNDSIFCGGKRESANEGVFDFNDFLQPGIVLTMQSDSGSFYRKLVIHELPVMLIDTPDKQPINSKEERVEGTVIKLVDGSGYVVDLGSAGIRGRGNSSWLQEKKPYNIKLDSKHEILGMPSSKHWILLSNAFYDRTQIRNAVAYYIAKLTDYPWVQDGRFVEVILNGEFLGLYLLCEKIGAEKHKIKIDEPDENHLTYGYLLESFVVLQEKMDSTVFPENYFNTNIINTTGYEPAMCNLGWEIKEPGLLDSNAIHYIRGSLCNSEILIRDGGGASTYMEQFDIETAINWWIIQELCMNEEASRMKNLFLYRKSGEDKLHFGPPWDFDAWSFGQLGTCVFYTKFNSSYFSFLFEDSQFVKRVKEKWNSYMPTFETRIPGYIDGVVTEIRRSAYRNEQMWPDWHSINEFPETSYDELIADMKNSLMEQLYWMERQISSF